MSFYCKIIYRHVNGKLSNLSHAFSLISRGNHIPKFSHFALLLIREEINHS